MSHKYGVEKEISLFESDEGCDSTLTSRNIRSHDRRYTHSFIGRNSIVQKRRDGERICNSPDSEEKIHSVFSSRPFIFAKRSTIQIATSLIVKEPTERVGGTAGEGGREETDEEKDW